MAGSKKPWKGKGTEEFADVRQEITDRINQCLAELQQGKGTERL